MITLLLHHILIELDKPESVTESGLVIPKSITDKERKATETGTVIQVGPTAFLDQGRDPSILSIGDRVVVLRYAGKTVVDTDEKEYVIFTDEDILCVIK